MYSKFYGTCNKLLVLLNYMHVASNLVNGYTLHHFADRLPSAIVHWLLLLILVNNGNTWYGMYINNIVFRCLKMKEEMIEIFSINYVHSGGFLCPPSGASIEISRDVLTEHLLFSHCACIFVQPLWLCQW